MTNAQLVKSQQFYCPTYTSDTFKEGFSFFLRILIAFAYLFTMLITLKNIIVEKETKMKEYLKLMGIKWYSIWIAWIIRMFIPYLILTFVLSIVCVLPFSARSPSSSTTQQTSTKYIFQYTAYYICLLTFLVYSIQVTMFGLLLGQIFSNCKKYLNYFLNQWETETDFLKRPHFLIVFWLILITKQQFKPEIWQTRLKLVKKDDFCSLFLNFFVGTQHSGA
jgi:hypothetical protein